MTSYLRRRVAHIPHKVLHSHTPLCQVKDAKVTQLSYARRGYHYVLQTNTPVYWGGVKNVLYYQIVIPWGT